MITCIADIIVRYMVLYYSEGAACEGSAAGIMVLAEEFGVAVVVVAVAVAVAVVVAVVWCVFVVWFLFDLVVCGVMLLCLLRYAVVF